MPVDPTAERTVTALSWVPDFARGFVRDYRVRWALEEAGLPYAVRLFDPRHQKPESYLAEQPWGQVPAYTHGEIALFESGAIALHIAEESDALLPADPPARARAKSWLIAALNSVEPPIQQLAVIDLFAADQPWARPSRPDTIARIDARLDGLVAYLGNRDWLEDRFTIGDLMMAAVLRGLHDTDRIAVRPTLAAYYARCLARPAFGRAIAAQFADFVDNPVAA